MKKVKFNVTTSFEMRPDELDQEYKDKYNHLRRTDYRKYADRIPGGPDFEIVHVKIDEIIDVPDHYYDRNKNRVVDQSVSFDKYVDRAGNRIPFAYSEAARHGDVKHDTPAVKSIKLFELIEDDEMDFADTLKAKAKQSVRR